MALNKASLSYLLSSFLLFSAVTSAKADRLGLLLPTDNKAIFSSNPSSFYMYTDRNFEGVKSKPWQGGTYGFSRNQKRTSLGIVYTRLHEGVDIKPMRRDSAGNPLDDIRAIADGQVVYTQKDSRGSNYGQYMVVHHDWGNGPFFSLYAHLASISAVPGQRVRAGQPIAKMGYTGSGLNRERAHLHLELCLLMSDRFQNWYDIHYKTTNNHGIYSGINLLGIDIANLYVTHQANSSISVPGFLAKSGNSNTEPYYKVRVPKKSSKLEIVRRYPWLAKGGAKFGAKSWDITFARTGIPLAVEASSSSVQFPAVVWVKPSGTNHSYHTVSRISGTGSTAELTSSGSRFIQLITGAF